MINVLDKGYVRLVNSMGDDLAVVNAARVSYDKESKIFGERDDRLLNFLVVENHTAPFRHGVCTYEVYAPLFVARQWWKHIVGGTHEEGDNDPYTAWNESSRRYVTENEEFYEPGPDQWRGKPANNKQGSAGFMPVRQGITTSELNFGYGDDLTQELRDYINLGVAKYRAAMEAGVAPEQARLFLPAYGMYVRWRWTTSLQGAMHFLKLRDEAHAQAEIRDYAKALREVTRPVFPVCMSATDV